MSSSASGTAGNCCDVSNGNTNCCNASFAYGVILVLVSTITSLFVMWCVGRVMRRSRWAAALLARFSSAAKHKRQVTSWLHRTPLVAGSANKRELPADAHASTRALYPFKGHYSLGRNLPLIQFTLRLHFDFTRSPPQVFGHGVDGVEFDVLRGDMSMEEGEIRCQLLEKFRSGELFVLYGSCDDITTMQWTGFWIKEDGEQKGSFHFAPDEETAARELASAQLAARLAEETATTRRHFERVDAHALTPVMQAPSSHPHAHLDHFDGLEPAPESLPYTSSPSIIDDAAVVELAEICCES